MILAGRLAGTLDGRSWSLEAEAEKVTLSVTSIWSLFKVRRVVRCALRQLPHDLSPMVCDLDTRIRIKCGGLPALSLSTRSTFFKLFVVGPR